MVDAELKDWNSLAERGWSTFLAGNGLSINLWDRFAYGSLFDAAALDGPLRDLFGALDTTNFEQGLECLNYAHLALRSLGGDTASVDDAYERLRDALFETVNAAHIPWNRLGDDCMHVISDYVKTFDSVFTTSYDLCLYWSQMAHQGEALMVDYFWNKGGEFDPENTVYRFSHGRHVTGVHYLHGALHLWQDDAAGSNGKWQKGEKGLLQVRDNYSPDSTRRPLFVSEGTSTAKLRTIRQSPYLTFCLDRLTEDGGPTVIFGYSLSDQDIHITRALSAGPRREIAVSLRPGIPDAKLIEEKARIHRALEGQDVVFFDATTHPLGVPDLAVG